MVSCISNIIDKAAYLGNIASGYRSGFGNMSFLEENANVPSDKIKSVFVKRAWKIAKTTYKLNAFTATIGKPNAYKISLTVGAVALTALNLFAGFYRVDNNKNRFMAAIWKVTPALLVITNIALLAFDVYTNPLKLVASVAAMAFTYVAPDTAATIAIPAKLVAFIFANNVVKTIMVVEWVATVCTSR